MKKVLSLLMIVMFLSGCAMTRYENAFEMCKKYCEKHDTDISFSGSSDENNFAGNCFCHKKVDSNKVSSLDDEIKTEVASHN